jgi:hypothetical protein
MSITKKLTALALSGALCASLSAQAAAYNDVSASANYAKAVQMLGALGVIQGYADGTFRPTNPITRAEACALISRILSPAGVSQAYTGVSSYTDVPQTLWSAPVISYCSSLGIVRGDGNGAFRPEDEVTNQEFITMLCRALNLDDDNNSATAVSYPDGYLALAEQYGLTDGVSLNPTASSQRGNDAQMVCNALFAEVDGQSLAQSLFGLAEELWNQSALTTSDDTDLASLLDALNEGLQQLTDDWSDDDWDFSDWTDADWDFSDWDFSDWGSDESTTAAPQQTVSSTTAQDTGSASDYIAEVVRLVNVERAAYGLSPLTSDDKLTQAAAVRASELPSLFDHTRPDGTSCFTALQAVGASYSSAGENIASGQPTPAAVVESWMNSPGHRANILSESFARIGVGYVQSGGTAYWVQLFTN